MGRLKGITVTLYETEPIATDPFGAPIMPAFVEGIRTGENDIVITDEGEIVVANVASDYAVQVDNVLVSPVSSEDIVNDTALYGKKTVYELGIPKGDTHDWKEKRVEFFGQRFQTVGEVTKGIDDMVPLEWNGKVKVVRYE